MKQLELFGTKNKKNPKGIKENIDVARRGGKIAGMQEKI